MGIEPDTAALPDGSAFHRRSWQDLEKWRLAIGLTLAPALATMLGHGLAMLVGVDLSSYIAGMPWSLGLILTLAFAEVWSLAFGAFYLATAPRRSGTITRANCIFVGALSAILFPPVTVAILFAIFGSPAPATIILPFSILFGLSITPLGVFGGWVFWAIGVRPAKPQLDQLDKVFE
jgi:hypothetical protein